MIIKLQGIIYLFLIILGVESSLQSASAATNSPDYSDSTKSIAFNILNQKCNVCHRKQNKRRVFNRQNMTPWAKDIYEQVFVKKRMPRGRKIKLSETEYQQLLNWIKSTQTL